jgi:maltose O-acetyltransferase
MRFRDDPLSVAARALDLARARLLFRRCQRAEAVSATGLVRVRAEGQIRLERGVSFVGGMLPTELISHPGAALEVGEATFVNYGVSLEAHEAVRVGRRCLLASFVRVCDRDERRAGPVIVEDDVWLAHGVIVGPGVTIGAGSVVSAGSVVTADVPKGSLASGNPAQCVPLSSSGQQQEERPGPWRSSSAS